jgi:hypothetical protein
MLKDGSHNTATLRNPSMQQGNMWQSGNLNVAGKHQRVGENLGLFGSRRSGGHIRRRIVRGVTSLRPREGHEEADFSIPNSARLFCLTAFARQPGPRASPRFGSASSLYSRYRPTRVARTVRRGTPTSRQEETGGRRSGEVGRPAPSAGGGDLP